VICSTGGSSINQREQSIAIPLLGNNQGSRSVTEKIGVVAKRILVVTSCLAPFIIGAVVTVIVTSEQGSRWQHVYKMTVIVATMGCLSGVLLSICVARALGIRSRSDF